MEEKSGYSISDFSPHLFWDVDPSKLDLERSAAYIVEKVLEYGLMEDWVLLKKIYGLERIKVISLQIRSLDNVTLSFVSTIFKIEKNKFRCFKNSQLATNFWNC